MNGHRWRGLQTTNSQQTTQIGFCVLHLDVRSNLANLLEDDKAKRLS